MNAGVHRRKFRKSKERENVLFPLGNEENLSFRGEALERDKQPEGGRGNRGVQRRKRDLKKEKSRGQKRRPSKRGKNLRLSKILTHSKFKI